MCSIRSYVTYEHEIYVIQEYEMCSVRTNAIYKKCVMLEYVTHEYEMYSVRTSDTNENWTASVRSYVTYENVLCLNI